MSQEKVVERRSVRREEESDVESSVGRETARTGEGSATPRPKRKKSRYDVLDEKFEALTEKFDSLVGVIQGLKPTGSGDKAEDELSLFGGSRIDSDSEVEQTAPDERQESSEGPVKSLDDIFGKACESQRPGLKIDNSQRQLLDLFLRCKTPGYMSAFSEELVDCFPLSTEAEEFLKVPPLDDIVESCLIKRHGAKASFMSGKTGKGAQLFSQPCKMVEKIAYKGSHASRMAIVALLVVYLNA